MSKLLTSSLFLAAFTFMAYAPPAHSAGEMCHELFQHPLAVTNPTQEKVVELLTKLNRVDGAHISRASLRVVFESDVRVFEDRLLTVLTAAEQGQPDLTAHLRTLFESMYYPEELMAPRLAEARAITPENILSVLGDLSKADTLRLFVGPNPAEVSPDSLLGRYLAETGAKLQTHSYSETNGAAGQPVKVSPERLAVPVDATTFPIFAKYFSNKQGYSVYGHANGVYNGTMYMNGSGPSPLGFLRVGTPLPLVLLKTTESARMDRYMTAFGKSAEYNWETAIRAPWNVETAPGAPKYLSDRGVYRCCTHWQGNIPIGDKQVNEITLPGAADKPLIVQVNQSLFAPAAEHLKQIWAAPVNEPISSVLGMAENNGRGEFASPGWVIQSYLVSAPLDRVPMVFIFANDAKAEIPADFRPNFEAPR